MVHSSVLARYLVSSLLVVGEVCSSHLANEGEWKRSQLEPRKLSQYTRIVQGLLRSDKIVRHLSDIPCNIIQTLENDAGQAKTFIDELGQRRVPTIIQHLPNEVIGAFSDVVGIFATLPTQIVGAAEAAVTDAVNVFNDIESGAIVSDLEKLPGVIVSDITNSWGDFRSGLVDDWNAAKGAITCLFAHCPVTTTAGGSCSGTQAITAQSSFQSSLRSGSSAIHPTSPPLSKIPSPTQTRPKPSSGLVVSSQLSPTQTRPKPSSGLVVSSQLSLSTFGSSPSPATNVAGGFKTDRTIFQPIIFQLSCFLGLGLLGVIFLL